MGDVPRKSLVLNYRRGLFAYTAMDCTVKFLAVFPKVQGELKIFDKTEKTLHNSRLSFAETQMAH